jgi:hypothetical protein
MVRGSTVREWFTRASHAWRVAFLIITVTSWYTPDAWAATVSTYAFGRYEIVIQEGTPFALSEFLGMVRRQTGLPEYPLMLGARNHLLELDILGPGNRPIQLATTKAPALTGSQAATASFVVERSAREGDTLTLQVRRAKVSGHVTLAVDLRALERRLEGER